MQPLVKQLQRATGARNPRLTTRPPAKGGKEVAEAREALRRVAVEIHKLRQREKPASGTPFAEVDALMQAFFDKALYLIALIGPSADVEDKENIEAVELAAHAVHAAGRALRSGGDSSSAITTAAVASLAASRGASLPQLLDDYHRHVGVVLAWRLGKARYEEHVLKHGRMGYDASTGKWRYMSGDEIVEQRERQSKYRAAPPSRPASTSRPRATRTSTSSS